MGSSTLPHPAHGERTVTSRQRFIRFATIKLAKLAAQRGDHREASRLYAEVGIQYVHEVQIHEPKVVH